MKIICSSASCATTKGGPVEVTPRLKQDPFGSLRASCPGCGSFLGFVSASELDEYQFRSIETPQYVGSNGYTGITQYERKTYRDLPAPERARIEERARGIAKRRELLGYDGSDTWDREAEARKRFAGIRGMAKTDGPCVGERAQDIQREREERAHTADFLATPKSIVKITE